MINIYFHRAKSIEFTIVYNCVETMVVYRSVDYTIVYSPLLCCWQDLHATLNVIKCV